jgi:hypothetical protein
VLIEPTLYAVTPFQSDTAFDTSAMAPSKVIIEELDGARRTIAEA